MRPAAPGPDDRSRALGAETPVDWAAWRGHFPDLATHTYLNTSSHGARSTRVEEAFGSYLESWTVEPPWDGAWQRTVRRAEAAFARLVHAEAPDVVMVPTLTDAFHRALGAAADPTRTRVVVGGREWVSLLHALQARPDVTPVTVDPDVHPDEDTFLSTIDRRTRIVAVSHVCYQTGYRADLARIAARAHEVGARVFVDAFQSAGVAEIDVRSAPVDFLAAGTLKYLLGVPGAAFMYVRSDVSSSSVPALSGWRGQRDPMTPVLDPADAAGRFAGGTWTVPNAYAAVAGMSLIEDVGIGAVAARVTRLVGVFQDELAARGMPCTTPRDPAKRAGIVTVPCVDAAGVLERLREERILASARGRGLRFAFHAYNTEAEARAVAQRLHELTQNRTR